MTREEIEKEIELEEKQINHLNTFNQKAVEQCEKNLANLKKQLAELGVEVYEPIYLSQSGHNYAITKNGKSGSAFEKYLERHNAGEELKKLISEENAKQGWKVDWTKPQDKYYISYDHYDNLTEIGVDCVIQSNKKEEYFSEQSAKDQDFLDKIKPLWLKRKGITE